ncbi:3'-5' exonuclease [Streptomyces sp. AV19]|uniref:exonuclease domain-containing protein n=1 Tax=Streptomyces sp. AV19 TaxID=2793068 RepID=UPI0018FF09ED|nr:exonuclease domain-containing protein [Streptomyces sp. AV19]MBH1938437.1 3'-5' exonuclease [Streptomyces sp. AV19]MDG4535085.1 exonuclease domain-containing protein [Streptomyces sp. AV19]
MGWHAEPLIGFDLETTGTDPAEARIVTAAVVETAGGEPVGRRCWLADPGVPVPAEATAVHGITGERAAAEGRAAREVVAEIAEALAGHWALGRPVVAYNAAFDLSLLAAELRRYGLPPLGLGPGRGLPPLGLGPVIDPLTIDRAVDRYRRGRRTLGDVCRVYGVVLDGAHEAGADALAAVRVARAIAERHPRIAKAGPAELHRDQVRWYGEWAEGYEAWLRRRGDAGAVVDGRWPVR